MRRSDDEASKQAEKNPVDWYGHDTGPIDSSFDCFLFAERIPAVIITISYLDSNKSVRRDVHQIKLLLDNEQKSTIYLRVSDPLVWISICLW